MKKYIQPKTEAIALSTGDLMDVLVHGSNTVNQNPDDNSGSQGSFAKHHTIVDGKFTGWSD